MSSGHLNREMLWDLAAQPALAPELQKHLTTCGDCQIQLAQVKQAQALLALNARPVPPPLDPIAMRRIGAVLKEKAEEELSTKSAFPWLRFGWVFAACAAAVLAFLVWNQSQVTPVPPTPIVKNDPVVVPAPVVPAPLVVPDSAPKPKLLAKVTGATKAKSKDGKVTKAQTISEGTHLATETGGALWLALPDGSRAGLAGGSALTVDTLEAKQLTFSLEKGNVVMVAKHLPERLMTVKAGEVEIRDIGTRFLVSRDSNRVLVAVEEGEVEISAPGAKTTLKAGRSAEWSEGQLKEQAWTPAPPPAPKPKVTAAPSPVVEAAKNPDPSGTPDIPPEHNPEEEWSTGGFKAKQPAPAPGPAPNPSVGGTPPPVVVAPVPDEEVPVYEAPPEDDEGSMSFVKKMERNFNKVKKAIEVPINAVGSTVREQRAREIGRLADEGSCTEALEKAADWLTSKQSASEAEPRWKRSVQVNQMRCYTRLGKTDEANKIKAQLQ